MTIYGAWIAELKRLGITGVILSEGHAFARHVSNVVLFITLF